MDGDKISRSIMEVDVFKDEIFDCIIIATDVAKYYYCEWFCFFSVLPE